MAIQAKPPNLISHQFQCSLCSPTASLSLLNGGSFNSRAQRLRRKPLSLRLTGSRSNANEPQDDFFFERWFLQDYLIDAPVSAGDGFSFSGVKAHPVGGTGEKAKDPIFGLTMGVGFQASSDVFKWFSVESGNADNPTVILIHGFPSQAYSYHKVLPVLSKDYRAIAFDWLGIGFSDKSHPDMDLITHRVVIALHAWQLNLVSTNLINNMDAKETENNAYLPSSILFSSLAEFVSALESFVNEIAANKVSLVVQGYFSPVVKYASKHLEKLNDLILLNPPLTAKHAKLPLTLSIFSNFLLGEFFSQDPLKAGDKALTSCGPYAMKEDDAMVYGRPYLTSGSLGFALNAISWAMKKELKVDLFYIYIYIYIKFYFNPIIDMADQP